jgi:hypothetical protein
VKQPNAKVGYWLGIFSVLGVLNLGLAALTDWFVAILLLHFASFRVMVAEPVQCRLFTMVIVPKTARRFHTILLDTTMR